MCDFGIMKIWRRGHIALEHKAFLESNSIQHEPWYKVVMPPHPRPILNYMFEISEDDPAWPELKRRIGKEYTYIGTAFTDDERLNAECCIIRGEYSIVSYRIPKGDAWSEEYFQDDCKKCGSGWKQIAPFRFNGEPKLGKNQFCGFGGGFELFCTQLVLDVFKQHNINSFETQPIILNKEKRPIENLRQIIVTEMAEPAVAEELVERERYNQTDCLICGRTLHAHYIRGILPLRKAALKPNVDFQLTNEWFWNTSSSRHEILVSQRVVRLILENKWKGAELIPIQAV